MNRELRHVGVLGMRWGVRRGSGSSSSSKNSADHNTAVALKRKKISEMSNAELKALTTRMQLERQYKDLQAKNVTKGQQFVTNFMKTTGKEILASVGKQILEAAINEAIKRAMGGKSGATTVIEGKLLND